ncbi:MAG: hypothetical protein PHE55_13405 [Methylococcaceae bacterium]|nr:hypothetical protein [Methylococcaceae bacterium]
MKKTSATGLILAGILICSGAYAEADEPKPMPKMQKLQSELKLNEQQTEEVRKIFEETKSQQEALRKQRQELHDKMRDRLKAVLTAEQMEKFEKLRQERIQRRGMGRHGHGN